MNDELHSPSAGRFSRLLGRSGFPAHVLRLLLESPKLFLHQIEKDFIAIALGQFCDLGSVMTHETLRGGHATESRLGRAQEIPKIQVGVPVRPESGAQHAEHLSIE